MLAISPLSLELGINYTNSILKRFGAIEALSSATVRGFSFKFRLQ